MVLKGRSKKSVKIIIRSVSTTFVNLPLKIMIHGRKNTDSTR
jgi:hypothetical protein